MSEPLPNCPLCDAPPTTWRRQWNCHPGTEFARCSTPRCDLRLGWMTSGLWRALAALRPSALTPDEADKLVSEHKDAVVLLMNHIICCSDNPSLQDESRPRMLRAADALSAALTGKR